MADDFAITGADQFLRLSKALKDAGRKTMRKNLNDALKDATKPLTAKTGAALAPTLPTRLQSKGRNVKQKVAVTTGKDPGVSITVTYKAKAGRGLHGANAQLLNKAGKLRRPVDPEREKWIVQVVPGARGWFDDTLTENAPSVRPHLERAIRDVEDRIVREAGL